MKRRIHLRVKKNLPANGGAEENELRGQRVKREKEKADG
jgi:hypothetical protein